MFKIWKYSLVIAALICSDLNAQISIETALKKSKSTKVSSLESFTELNQWVENNINSKDSISKFYFHWIINNIDYDYELRDTIIENSTKYHYTELINDSAVLASKTALCLGFSHLYKTALNFHQIPCEMIEGYTKNANDYIEGASPKIDHVWNAFYIDNNWKLADVTWGGHNKDMFGVDEFFYDTEPELNILSHYPLNPRWQLITEHITKDKFISFPYISTEYFSMFRIDDVPQLISDNGRYFLTQHIADNWKAELKLIDEFSAEVKKLKLKKTNTASTKQFEIKDSSYAILRLDASKKSFWQSSEQEIQALAYFIIED